MPFLLPSAQKLRSRTTSTEVSGPACSPAAHPPWRTVTSVLRLLPIFFPPFTMTPIESSTATEPPPIPPQGLQPVEYLVGQQKKSVPVPLQDGDWSDFLWAQVHEGIGKGG